MFGLWLIFYYIANFFFFLNASVEENSKKDTLSWKALFSQFSLKAPIECHLCTKKSKSKSGYTLHLKKCSPKYTCFTTE